MHLGCKHRATARVIKSLSSSELSVSLDLNFESDDKLPSLTHNVTVGLSKVKFQRVPEPGPAGPGGGPGGGARIRGAPVDEIFNPSGSTLAKTWCQWHLNGVY